METARIELNGTFTASDLDEILQSLAATRSAMQPPIPTTAPTPDATGNTLINVDETLFTVRRLIGGGVRIWLRSDGYGWLSFAMSAQRTEQLANFLRDEFRHTHPPH